MSSKLAPCAELVGGATRIETTPHSGRVTQHRRPGSMSPRLLRRTVTDPGYHDRQLSREPELEPWPGHSRLGSSPRAPDDLTGSPFASRGTHDCRRVASL